MTRKNRTPEENARREKIRELLRMANIGSTDEVYTKFGTVSLHFLVKQLPGYCLNSYIAQLR